MTFYVVITLDSCGFCIKAKELLKKTNNHFVVLEKEKLNPQILEKLMKRFNKQDYKSFPRIFSKGKFIGGYIDLEKIFSSNKNVK